MNREFSKRSERKNARIIKHILTLAHIFSMRSVCTKSCLLGVKWCKTITAIIQFIGNVKIKQHLEPSNSAGRGDTVPRQQHLPQRCCHIQQETKMHVFKHI